MTEVTCAIIIRKKEVLVTQRSESMPHPLKWEFPGGKIKEGESVEESIKREIREELGILIDVERLLPSVTHHYGSMPVRLIPLICRLREGHVILAEHKAFRWIPLDELDEVDWLDADRGVIRILKERL
jgi:8-oxo-dGTP diphosphatase